jgi:hypothetical protein
MLARLAYQYRGARRLRSTAMLCSNASIVARVETLSAEFKVQAPLLLISTRITKPLLTGIFRAAIILPPSVISLTPQNVELILKHELAHLKRRDLAWNTLAAVAHTLLWFNPLTWLCERESRFTQEIACDELALANQFNRAPELANLLVDFAARRERSPQLLTVSIIRTANTLERRLKAMKTIHRKGPRQLIGAAIVALALTPALIPWRAIAQKPDTASTPENIAPPTAADIPATKSTTEEELLGEEIKLARDQLATVMRANKNGAASSENVIRQKAELQKLERDLAGLHNDTPKIRASLEGEIKDFEKLQASAAQRVQNGVASTEEKLKIDRELLRLKRELASLDRLEPASTNNSGSGANMSMMYYMSNPELMKRYFPQMYATMMKNGGTNALPHMINPPNNAQENFQDRLRRAYGERSVIRLQPKRPGVVISVVVKAGDHVTEGQNLVHLDDREARISLRAAESAFAIAQADYALKKKELENNLRWNQNSVKNSQNSDEFKKSQQEEHDLKLKRLDSELLLASIKIEQAQLQLDDLTVKAPSNGLIGKVPFAGQTLTDGSVAVEFLPDPPK